MEYLFKYLHCHSSSNIPTPRLTDVSLARHLRGQPALSVHRYNSYVANTLLSVPLSFMLIILQTLSLAFTAALQLGTFARGRPQDWSKSETSSQHCSSILSFSSREITFPLLRRNFQPPRWLFKPLSPPSLSLSVDPGAVSLLPLPCAPRPL